MVAVVGLDPVGGIERYDFDMPYLLAGIHFIPTILGFFAVSEIFVQAEKKAKGSYIAPKMSVDFPSLAELIAHKWAVVRSISYRLLLRHFAWHWSDTGSVHGLQRSRALVEDTRRIRQG